MAFNRLDTVKRVLPAVREARPARLYLACDGPRPGRVGEDLKVQQVRSFMTDGIDWDCEVKTLFRSENLGCARAVSGAVNWFFEHEESGIILEDDCLPDPSFFTYCDELLDRYRDEGQVMHISGCSLVDFEDTHESYFFSHYPQVWGWATWREAWAAFSLDEPNLASEIDTTLSCLPTVEQREYSKALIERAFSGDIDTWDYCWAYAILKHSGMSIHPTLSLVRNIGFGKDATHTKSWKDYRGIGDRSLQSIESITHPSTVEVNHARDSWVYSQSYKNPSVPVKALKVLRHLLSRH